MDGARKTWITAVVVASIIYCTAAQNDSPRIPEISSSVLVFGPSDYLVNGGTSRCQQIVRNAQAYKQSSIMVVPTAFWVDADFQARKTVNSQGRVTYYCHDRTNGNGTTPTSCLEATQAQIDTFTSSMAACFRTIVDAGLNIALSPHLDDGLGYGGWRNGLVFDPLMTYGRWTYADFFLYPLADALAQVITPNTRVRFSMQGEMSATVVYHPDSYIRLLALLKDRVLRNSNIPRANIQVGVSTNFNKICGCVLQDLVDTYEYVRQFPAAFAPLKSQFNLTAIAALYSQTDYIGISSYPSLTPGFSTQQLEAATQQFDFEIGQFGVDLKDLNVRQGKPLYWNEYGLGGGNSQNGDEKATTAVQAAANPYFGIFGQYTRALDPWVLYDLSQPSPVRDYLRYFYTQTVNYATQTGTNSTFQYRVAGIYLWNGGSWDIQAIYPESTSQEGSYRDPIVTQQISDYNARAIAANGSPSTNTGSGGIAPSSASSNNISNPAGTTVNPAASSSTAGSGLALPASGRKLFHA